MKTRKLGAVCALLAATPWLIGCETTSTSAEGPVLNFRNSSPERKNVDSCRISSSVVSPSRLSALQR